MVKKFLVVFCAGLLLLAGTTRSFAQERAGAFTVDGQIALNAYQAVIEEHLVGALNGLKALAATQDAKSGDWEHIKGPLGQLSADMPHDAVTWFAKPDGSYATVSAGLTDKNLKDRDYFPVLMAGKDVNDSIMVSKTTGISTVVVATPVMKDGQVIGALGASLSLEKLAKLVDDTLGLPKDITFYALTAKGQAALHKDPSLILQYPAEVGDDSLKSAVKTMLSQPQGTVHYTFKGAERTVIFKKSPVTGWVFVLGVVH